MACQAKSLAEDIRVSAATAASRAAHNETAEVGRFRDHGCPEPLKTAVLNRPVYFSGLVVSGSSCCSCML